jgi:hypothetical protein
VAHCIIKFILTNWLVINFCSLSSYSKIKNILVNFIELSHSWESDSRSAGHKIPSLLGNPEIQYCIHRRLPSGWVVKHLNPIHIFRFCFCKIQFDKGTGIDWYSDPRLDNHGIEVQFRARARDLNLLHSFQTATRANSAVYLMGTKGSFLGARMWSWHLTPTCCWC